MRLAIAAALACLSGCVPMVSHYHPDFPTRRNVEKAMTGRELQGMTREEQVLGVVA